MEESAPGGERNGRYKHMAKRTLRGEQPLPPSWTAVVETQKQINVGQLLTQGEDIHQINICCLHFDMINSIVKANN